jgi:hypothetical protein
MIETLEKNVSGGNNTSQEGLKRIIIAGTGIVAGFILAAGLGSFEGPCIGNARVFQEDNKPKVMRLYKVGSADQLMVEDLENVGCYVPSKIYLNAIENEPDREIEAIKLRKRANWYVE